MAGARATKPGGSSTPPSSGIALENTGTPVTGGPFGTLDADDASVLFADLGSGKASVRAVGGGSFPPTGPCVNIGTPATGWVAGNFVGPEHAANNTQVAWSPTLNLFVVMQGGAVQTSPDGKTWTRHVVATAINGTALVWAPALAKFIAIGALSFNAGTKVTTIRALRSADGVTWTHVDFVNVPHAAISEASFFGSALAWADDLGLLVAVADAGDIAPNAVGQIFTSPDGVTWTQRADQTSGLVSVAYSPQLSLGLFVAMGVVNTAGAYQDFIYTSPDGITWTAQTPPVEAFPKTWFGLTWSDPAFCFVAVGIDGSGGAHTGVIMSSSDGITWTVQTSPLDGSDGGEVVLWASGYQGGLFIVENVNTGHLTTSPDGTTWTAEPTSFVFANLAVGAAYSPMLNVIVLTGSQNSPPTSRDFAYTIPGTGPCFIYGRNGSIIDMSARYGTANATAMLLLQRVVIGNPDLTDPINYNSSLNVDCILPTADFSGGFTYLNIGGDESVTATGFGGEVVGVKVYPEIDLTIAGSLSWTAFDGGGHIVGTGNIPAFHEFDAGGNWNALVGLVTEYAGLYVQPHNTSSGEVTTLYGAYADSQFINQAQHGFGFFVAANWAAPFFTEAWGLYLTDSDAFFGGAVKLANNVDGAGAGVGTLTTAPHAGNPDAWLEVWRNGVQGWVPWWHA